MDDAPLLRQSIPVVGAADYRGGPVYRDNSGKWNAALFILVAEIAERSVFFGINSNLIIYLTEELGQSTAAAVVGLNTWYGVSMILPLFGAFIADSYLGRYKTIVVASFLYVLGLAMLTLSSSLSTLHHPFRIIFFYFSLYLVAFAQGGHKSSVQAFGADQFDKNDPQELVSRSSFFNWWYFGMSGGMIVSILILPYVEDNISWGLGFGIPCIVMVVALFFFLMGAKSYRYYQMEDTSPFVKICNEFTSLLSSGGAPSHNLDPNHSTSSDGESGETKGQYKLEEDGCVSSTVQVEEKEVLRLLPVWASCLVFAIVTSQGSFFTKQGSSMDRRIGVTFQVPSASLSSLSCITAVIFIPIYDRKIVPKARELRKTLSGITPLQRIGTGIFISIVSMVVAALVEMKRLKTVRDFGLIDLPNETIPMSLWWLTPQYILFGIQQVFVMIGLQEFLYDQVPDSLRSLGLGLCLCIFGMGSFASSFLVSVIDNVTTSTGESWFSNNLNRSHLDYYYLLLAGLSSIGLLIYLFFAQAYIYKNKGNGSV